MIGKDGICVGFRRIRRVWRRGDVEREEEERNELWVEEIVWVMSILKSFVLV